MLRKILALVFVFALVPAFAHAQQPSGVPGSINVMTPAERPDSATNTQHSHTTGATLTLTAGAAGGPQQSIYITGMDISNCVGGSAVTAAAPTYITTTGLNGNPQYQIGSNPATAGLCSPTSNLSFTAPLKSQTPGTNVTLVLPAFITNQTVSVNIYYRLGW